ncbi:MAG TPA: tyrosine-type recombinase/integrase [Candidatus Thermoplasmatota archaeon]|nr:tyrosine-type recombinase/integrase [Candidatus Thermoplasmatota archaeon]
MGSNLHPRAQALLEEFRADLLAQALEARSAQTYCQRVGQFLSFLGETPVEAVTQDTLKAFLGELRRRRLEANTVMRYFVSVGSLFVFLEAEGRVPANPVPTFRRRYLRALKRDAGKNEIAVRQLLSVEDMRRLVHSLADVRDRAVLVVLAKCGVRAGELVAMDVEDINWKEGSIRLKKKRKRSNRIVFFDDEAARTLKRWLALRKARGAPDKGPLFVGDQGRRLHRNAFHEILVGPAEALGLHDPEGPIERRFSAHCARHWFTTHLRRQGMTREHIGWLRGDAPRGTMDIYLHIDPAEVRESYLARIPKLGL